MGRQFKDEKIEEYKPTPEDTILMVEKLMPHFQNPDWLLTLAAKKDRAIAEKENLKKL